jgi:DNA double-strand break repair and V(D)J recombination protein XRCC4
VEDQVKGLEVVAAVGSGRVTINLRNRIDKITQRLGSVELSQDDNVEIQLFDWCGSAIDQKSALEAEKSDLRSKHDSAQATVASLQAKLEELVRAKADHEEELISKFVLLLNEKKLKIRNQQRLLSTAKVDQKKLQQMQKTLDGKGRRARSSRTGKRRAAAGAEEDESQTDSSDAFEKMDVDKQEGIATRSQEASSERQTTPETETATESDNAAPEPASKVSPAPRPSTSTRTKASKKTTSPPPKPSKTRQAPNKSTSPPPPIRQLPFAKKGAKTQKTSEPEPEPEKPQKAAGIQDNAKAKADDSGEDTETDDDEL